MPPPDPGRADAGPPAAAAAARGAVAPGAHGVRAFLPNELDPTVFDEGFLRQLERLGVLMKQPVRGGLKGGRRSVKRGQSVEFADYREYALGDDLRQLDWNVYARLEKLFVKLFIEEEDVTISFLLDASPSMAFGRPEKLLFAKRAAAALGYIGLAVEDRVVDGAHRADGAPPERPARVRARLPAAGEPVLDPARRRADRPPRRARHAAAMLSGRGVVVLLSDLLDPGADRVIRELAATGSELIVLHVLSPDELDPALEGDLRLVDSESGDGIDVTVDLATLDDYKARLAAWQEGLADLATQAAGVVRAAVHGRAARRPRVRRAAPPARGRVTMPFLAPLALAGLLFMPLVIAMYLLKLRRDEAVVPSTLLWQRLVADVEANAPWQRLRRSLLLLLQLLLVLILVFLAARPFLERPAGLAGDLVLVIDTSASMQATDVDAEPPRGGEGGRGRRPQGPAGRRQGQRDRGRADGQGRRQRHLRRRAA